MMMRASASGIEDEETMGFDGGVVGSDPEAAELSPADPNITKGLSNSNNWKILMARLLLIIKVLNGRNQSTYVNPNSEPVSYSQAEK
jgi:hypothetical protein